jgi:hypothetical protein
VRKSTKPATKVSVMTNVQIASVASMYDAPEHYLLARCAFADSQNRIVKTD